MPYSQDDHYVIDSAVDDHGAAAAINMNAAAGAILTKTFKQPVTVSRFGYQVTTAFNYNTLTQQGVLGIYKYPAGVSGNKVLLGTINLQDGDAAMLCPFVDLDNQPVAATAPYTGLDNFGVCDVEPGDQVVIEVKTQATGGGYIAGAFQPFFCFVPRAEAALNMPRMVDRTPDKAAVTSNKAAAESTE